MLAQYPSITDYSIPYSLNLQDLLLVSILGFLRLVRSAYRVFGFLMADLTWSIYQNDTTNVNIMHSLIKILQ